MFSILIFATILVGLVPGSNGSVPVSARLIPKVAHANADDIDVVVHFRNASADAWYLVWYGFQSCIVDAEGNTLRYVEDLDRDPDLCPSPKSCPASEGTEPGTCGKGRPRSSHQG